jgi:hypothetical protein
MASMREGSTRKMAAPRVTMRMRDQPGHSGRPAQESEDPLSVIL